jgi:hypothetical protein
MRESKRKMLFTVLDTTYGANAATVREKIKTECARELMGAAKDHRRTLFEAATVVSHRTASFLQAQRVVLDWAEGLEPGPSPQGQAVRICNWRETHHASNHRG